MHSIIRAAGNLSNGRERERAHRDFSRYRHKLHTEVRGKTIVCQAVPTIWIRMEIKTWEKLERVT